MVGLSVLDSPLVVQTAGVVGIGVWWLTYKAPWSEPGDLETVGGEQRRYVDARDRLDTDENAHRPR